MNTKGIKSNKSPYMGENISSEEMKVLRRQVYELQLEVDILKKTISVLKNTRRRPEEPEKQGKDNANLRHAAEISVTETTSNSEYFKK